MIEGKTVLAIIPARGGSKGVPRKNIRDLCGKPLIAWTIEEAKKSNFIDRLILSSDDDEIINVAKRWGCEVPFVRPSELAQDTTPGIEPVLHAVRMLPGYDYVVLLQPTSPLRTANDIDACIEKCDIEDAHSCVSVTEPDKSPYWMYFIDESSRMKPILKNGEQYTRRQDLPKTYVLNGAIYVIKCEFLIKNERLVSDDTVPYIMDKKKSIDIDDEIDLEIIKNIMNKGNN